MASPARLPPDPVALRQALETALRDRPEAFEFFEAMRRLDCAHPQRPRLGTSTKAGEDGVRLRQTPSMAFAPRMIDRYEPASGSQAARLNGFFFGLFGPNGPLPLHLTEHALQRERYSQDTTFTAFADVFHHRMMSLFYRAWAESQPTVQADRPETDRFAFYTGALIGLSTPRLEQGDALPDHFKRFFAARLMSESRNAQGLQMLLEQFFQVPVRVIEFVAEWMRLPAQSQLRLGTSMQTGSLGVTTVAGEWVWGAQQRFRLRIGALSRAEFDKFLPGGEALAQLTAAVRLFAGDEKSWDVQLVLRKDQVPRTRLGISGRLGLSTWMARSTPPYDAEDVVLKPCA